jgi:hypothetical protein
MSHVGQVLSSSPSSGHFNSVYRSTPNSGHYSDGSEHLRYVPCVTSNAGPNGAMQLYWR